MLSLLNYYFDFDKLVYSYKKVTMGKRRYKPEAVLFHRYDMVYLVSLWREIQRGTYEPGGYNHFWVYEPKKRLINAPSFKDKIVQYALHEALCDIYRSVYIKHSYSCLTGRGSHLCAKTIQSHMQICKRVHNGGWVIKIDVAKYFYSIDRDILKRILRKRVDCPDILKLLDLVIDSSPEGDRGIPLGNVTSQDLANIYLNEVDKYVVRYLGCKYYARFMDDIVIVVENKEMAKDILSKVKVFLANSLGLTTNSKTQVFPIAQGVNSCGYKINTTHMMLRNKSKQGMKRRMKKMDEKVKESRIDVKDVQQAVDSWIGHAMHAESYGLIKKIFKPYPYIINKKEVVGLEQAICKSDQ